MQKYCSQSIHTLRLEKSFVHGTEWSPPIASEWSPMIASSSAFTLGWFFGRSRNHL